MERRVLVTGGSGYVAGFCVAQVLNEGGTVRVTVRDAAKGDALRRTLGTLCDPRGVQVVAADLMRDEGWAAAVDGCDTVLHVASPIPGVRIKSDDELVVPARDGALRVLRAARDAGVRRVVMTASTASICYGRGGRDAPFTESDWTDAANRADTSAYERSKTLAERAARDWMAAEGGALELVTIHPGAVLGPVLSRDFSASLDIVKKMMDGSLPGLPRFGFPIVDVRDIADAHLRAMRADVAGERFLCSGPFLWFPEIAAILKSQLPDRRVPTRVLPDWLVRVASLLDPVVRERLFELGKHRPVRAAKAERLLGWVPRPAAETIRATAESLIAHGVVKA